MAFKHWFGIGLLLAVTISITSSKRSDQLYLTDLYIHFRTAFWFILYISTRQFAVVTIGQLNVMPQVDQYPLPLTHPDNWNAAFYGDTLPAHTEPVLFDSLRQMVLDHLQETGHLPQNIYLYTHNIPCIDCTGIIVAFVHNFRGYIQEFVNANPQFANALGEVGQLTFRIAWTREAGNYDESLATIEDFADTNDDPDTPRIVIYRMLRLDGTCNWNGKKKRQVGSDPVYLPNSWYTTTVKSMKHISTGISGVWAVDANDYIYYRPGTYGVSDAKGVDTWEKVPGQLKQLDVGYNIVWGVNSNDEIFRRVGITKNNPKGTSWEKLSGLLKHVSVSSKGSVWGVNTNDDIFVRIEPNWIKVQGKFSQVSVGRSGVWAVDSGGKISVRSGTFGDSGSTGSSWRQISGLLMYICSGESAVWGVNKEYQLFYRYGVTAGRPQGLTWIRVSGALKQVEVNGRGMWGVGQNNKVQGRWSSPSFDLTQSTWKSIDPSGLSHVSTGWSGVWALTFINSNILYRESTYGSNSNSMGSNSWKTVAGHLDQLDVGKGVVWGVYNGKIKFREGLSRDNPTGSSWTEISGELQHVTVSPAGYVWGVNSKDQIARRKGITENSPKGTGWEIVQGRLVQISAGLSGVWGVNSEGTLYYRAGTHGDKNTAGTGWTQISWSRKVTYVSSGNNIVWVTTWDDDIYRRQGILATKPTGTNWRKVRGKLRQVEVYDDYNGVWGINKGRDVFASYACSSTFFK